MTILRRPGGFPSTFGLLLARELGSLAKSLRFRMMAVLIVGLMLASAVSRGQDYRAELLDSEMLAQTYRASIDGQPLETLVDLPLPLAQPPWKLSFLVDGGWGHDGLSIVYDEVISPLRKPSLREARGSNPRLPIRANAADWAMIFSIVIPLFAFILCYDAMCGGEPLRVLKAVLAQPVSRLEALFAKLLATWLGLAAALLLGAFLGFAALWSWLGIRFAPAELLKGAAVLAVGLASALLFISIALLVSIWSRDRTRSLALLAILWVAWVVAVPAAGALAARGLRAFPGERQVAEAELEIRRRVESRHGGPGNWRGRGLGRVDDYAYERKSATIQNERYVEQEAFRRRVWRLKIEQVALANALSLFSPSSLIYRFAEDAAGAGMGRQQQFLEQSWSFSEHFRARLAAIDRRDPESPHILFFAGYLSEQGVDASELPSFVFEERSLAGCARGARSESLLLLLWLSSAFGMMSIACLRMEI